MFRRPGAKRRILIIEDDVHLRRALADYLQKAGYKVGIARDGYIGLVKALDTLPHLILLDLLLPKMDGMAFLEALRYDQRGKNIKVMILSNLDDSKVRRHEAEKFGVIEYMTKADWKLEDVVKKIKQVV